MRLSALLLSLVCSAYAIQQDIHCECEKCSTPKPVETCHADIMILMDASVCHAGEPWARIRKFGVDMAQQLERTLDVQNSKTRVGYYAFSNKMETCAGFDTTHEEARQNVKDCELLGGNTNYQIMTDRVIEVFGQSTASHKYTILITNGKGTESKDDEGRHPYTEGQIDELSNQLKNHNIRVLPVSINDACSPDKEDMPDQNCPKMNLLKLWSFNSGLANAQMPFSMLNVGTPRVISTQIQTHLTEDRGSCTDDKPRPTPKPTQCQLADVTILVDGSDSISRSQWATQTSAVSSWMQGYWQDSPNTQITVVQFSDDVERMFGPSFEGDESDWAKVIRQTEQISSSTSLHKALKHVTSDEFERERARKLTSTNGRLDQRFRMLFVLSDGWPTDTDFGELSNDVNEKFDIIIAVGVGEEAEIDTLAETIQQLRFSPEQTHLTAVSDYNQLRDRIPLIHRKVCALEHRMVLGRKKRNFTPVQLNRKKRQIANRGPRPDNMNFGSECDESGFCNCKCTMPIIEISGIQGPRGNPGPRGDDGRDGQPGEVGNDGRDGSNGRDGNRGKEGDKGNPGEDGADGRDGVRGVEGPQGARGEEGRQGPKGPPGKEIDALGKEGERGDSGSPGRDGQSGRDGRDGEKGPAGRDGQRGRPGANGEPGPDGRDGQPGGARDGECGPMGRSGQPGEAGYDGDNGNDGADGVDGPRGAAGDAGLKGNNGPAGSKGASGDEGDPGKHGEHGQEGAAGQPGKAGDRGMNGFNGDQGPKGPRGEDGTDGVQGERGPAGFDGLDGNVGKPGMPGNNGDVGEPGDDGQDGDDGPAGSPGDHGDEGEKGRKGQRGVQGRPGEVDAERLYAEIKEMVRQKMYPNGCPAKCKKNPKPKPNPNPMIPLNAVFLVDGSDSIRSGTNDGRDEWVTATNAIKETVDKLDIHFFSLVQFSKDNVDHIENFNIKRDGKDAAKEEIESELRDTQMKDTTNTYHALDHVSTMYFEEADGETAQKDVLFVITDGEPRDDEDSSYVDEVLLKVRDKFDYVFVAVIGEEMRQSYADYSGIQGKIQTSPIYIDDYGSMARKLVPHFTRTSKASFDQFIRMKRSLKKRSTRRTRRIFKTKFD